MTAACIIQARMGSSRLPAKVLLPLPTGRTVIEEVIFRCNRILGIDVVVAALPDTPENDILATYCQRARIYRGPELDVLGRYAGAAGVVGADTVMRITADCPMIDPQVCERVLNLHHAHEADYTSNVWPSRNWPPGYDCEVFSAHALATADIEAGVNEREHVTTYIRTWAQKRRRVSMIKSMGLTNWTPLTLDTLDDYVRIWKALRREVDSSSLTA